MEKEKVFSLSGEGEGLSIYREILSTGINKFNVVHWSMFDDNEDFVIPDKIFNSFEEAFADIKRRRAWFLLYISDLHVDYQNLIEKEIKLAEDNERR